MPSSAMCRWPISRENGFACFSIRSTSPSSVRRKSFAFNKAIDDFEDRNTVVMTASTDSVYSHKGWCDSHDDLKKLRYLMLADTTHDLSRKFGVLKEDAGIAYRGVFLIDPNGVVRWLAIHDLGVGRNVDEVIRVLDALQTDKLCPCNWKKGEKTIN